ncbi:hypothetical protein ARMSODRAFT_971769 [Armillaria solidipes]|uniref:Uncharacterized protein n=1 Tax=Armillaria solidipes TaxID=1076256 RepID=A0A2H3C4P9_9AGAR|nr:hypothetical protein ARMSODRAFT_971769 [Armillaria solidipes]
MLRDTSFPRASGSSPPSGREVTAPGCNAGPFRRLFHGSWVMEYHTSSTRTLFNRSSGEQCFPKAIRLNPGSYPERASKVASSWTAIEWASCISNEQLTKDDICWVWEIIEDKLTPYGCAFSFVGEELDVEFMVVTRRAMFRRGYTGMDPATIPQFKEGNEGKVVRRLIEEEGLDHLEFSTRLNSQG